MSEDALLDESVKTKTIAEIASRVDTEFEKTLKTSRQFSRRVFGKKIWFYAPTFAPYKSPGSAFPSYTFPSVSVTGKHCALNCLHCGGKLLNTMLSVSSPRDLFRLAQGLKEKGSLGFLLSGGCLPDGSVPFGRFLGAIGKIKRELGLTVLVHTGLIGIETAKKMKESGVDGALIDVIGSDRAIKEIYNLKGMTVQDYDRSLEALHRSGIPTIPHVLFGLYYGRVSGEYHALDVISKYAPSALVVIVLRPLQGTSMATFSPPPPKEIAKFIAVARLTLEQTPIVLGCVRPLGEHKAKTDRLAIMAGVNGVVFPSSEAIETAKALGLESSFSGYCCAQIFRDVMV